MRRKLTAAEKLTNRHGFLLRTDLAELGFGPKAVDAIFRELPIVALPGYTRPMIRVSDYLDLLERSTYRDDRVRQAA